MLRRELMSLATALAFLLPSGRVVAQETAAGGAVEERTEEIVVTGTRIRRKDLTTPAPVTVISRDQIEASGKISIGDFLQALPEQGNSINTQFNNGGNGATRVSLRGMGSERTLVLLNGRRFVPGGSDSSPSSAVDLNAIPANAIERVEILKDGGSAIYGSDAITGVVNLITRKTFSGTSLSALTGVSSAGDGAVYELNLSGGTSGEKGNILFSAGYFTQQEVWAGDRDYSKQDKLYDYTVGEVVPLGSSAIPAGRVTLNPATCTSQLCADLFTQYNVTTATNFMSDPTAALGFRPYTGADQYNYQPENYLVTPSDRLQLFAIGDTNLGALGRGYFEASYVNRQSSQKLAPEPLFTITSGLTFSADSYYNPFGVDFTDVRRRLVEFGNRDFAQDFDTFRIVGGIDGNLPEDLGPLSGWFYDFAFNYGRTQGVGITKGTLRAPLVQNAIGPSFATADPDGIPRSGDETVVCGNPGADGLPGTDDDVIIDGCTPINLLGPIGDPGNVAFSGSDRITTQLRSFQVNTSGDLFQLMGDRPAQIALGYEYRDQSGQFLPNPITASFENTGNNSLPTAGEYNVHEVYGELNLPLVSNMPFAQDLEAVLAARYFNYSTFGDDVTYKVGARWRPIPDVTVRGTFSTAFRAPSIPELFAGRQQSFPTASDPCAGSTDPASPDFIDPNSALGQQCAAEGPNVLNNGDDRAQLLQILGGNQNLQPETADVFTVGLVFEPRWVKNLSFTLDYYSISLDEAITNVGSGTILGSCYSTGQFCSSISRTPSGLIDFIDDRQTNVGSDKTAGLDFAARYALPSPYGRFAFGFDGTWLQKYDRTLPDGTVVKGKGTYDLIISQDGGVFPEFKFNTGVTWAMGGLGAGLTVRYIGSIKECSNADGESGQDGLCYIDQTDNLGVPQLSRTVDPWAQTDLFASYALKSFAGNTTVSVGVNNLFDDNPRVVYNGFLAASDAATYDYMGRYYWVRLAHSY